MPAWLSMAVAFGLSFGLALATTPLARWLGRRAGWFVRLSPRHIHGRPTPRSGGLAIALAAVAGLLVVLLPAVLAATEGEGSARKVEVVRVGLLVVGSLLTLALILWDDVRGMSPGTKLLAQFAVAAVAIVPALLGPPLEARPGLIIDQVQNPLGGTLFLPLALAGAFTFLWLIGMMNTVNLLDGLDGLAAGVTAIAALLLFVHMVRLGQNSLAPLPLALAGACLGFLPYNFHPARVFMGDSGAMFLGYCLGVLSIIGGAKMATALLVLGVPILDAAWVLVFRLSRGRSPLRADRGHLHHRLLDLGLSQVRVVLLFYLVCAGAGALAIFLPSGLAKLLVLVGLVLGLGALLWWLARKQLDRSEAAG